MQTAIRQGGGVAITRLDAPQAGPDEVLVEVRCTGIAPEEWGWGALGGTVVGRVVGKGANVRDRREGDWLVGLRGPDLPCGGLGTLSLLESHLCAPCAEMTKDQYVLLPFLGLIASAHLLISQELRTTPGDTIFISACPEQAIYAQVASILGLKVFVTKAIPLPTPVPANVTVLQADPENAVQVAAGLLQETSGLGVDCAFLTADILELAKVWIRSGWGIFFFGKIQKNVNTVCIGARDRGDTMLLQADHQQLLDAVAGQAAVCEEFCGALPQPLLVACRTH